MDSPKHQRGIRPDKGLIAFIKKERTGRGWSQLDMVSKPPERVSLRVISNIERGKNVDLKSLALIAAKFGMSYDEMVRKASVQPGEPAEDTEEVVIARIKIKGDASQYNTVESKLRLAERIIAELLTKKIVEVVMAEPYKSTKLSIRMTRADAEKLQAAIEAGKFDDLEAEWLGMDALPAESDQAPLETGLIYGKLSALRAFLRLLVSSRMLSLVSIALSLSGLYPIEAFPLYLIGLVMGVGAVVLRWKRPMGWVLPAVGVVLNSVAAVVWPNVIGVFHEQGGYHFRYGERARYGQVQFVIHGDPPEDERFHMILSEQRFSFIPPPDSFEEDFTGGVSPVLTTRTGEYFVSIESKDGRFRYDTNAGEPDGQGHRLQVYPSIYGVKTVHITHHPGPRDRWLRERIERREREAGGLRK